MRSRRRPSAVRRRKQAIGTLHNCSLARILPWRILTCFVTPRHAHSAGTGDIRKVSLWLGQASIQSYGDLPSSRSDREARCTRNGDTAGAQAGQIPGAGQADGNVQRRKARVVM